MKKLWVGLMSVVLAISLAGCGGDAKKQEAKSEFIIKLANYYGPDHPMNQSVAVFKKIVEEKTGGKVKVQNFSNNALGSSVMASALA